MNEFKEMNAKSNEIANKFISNEALSKEKAISLEETNIITSYYDKQI